METDRILYNIEQLLEEDDAFREQTYAHVNKKISIEQLKSVHSELLSRMNRFDPDDEMVIEQIKDSLKLYRYFDKYQKKSITTSKTNQSKQQFNEQTQELIYADRPLQDQGFICNLAFFIQFLFDTQKPHISEHSQKDSLFHESEDQGRIESYRKTVLNIIHHQLVDLQNKQYAKSINLFKALSQLYPKVQEDMIPLLVELMLEMLSLNVGEFYKDACEPYHFLECLLQVVNKGIDNHSESNKEKSVDSLQKKLRLLITIYSELDMVKEERVLLFHEKDFRILIEVLFRFIRNNLSDRIAKVSLQLYLILVDRKTIREQKFKVEDFKSLLADWHNFQQVEKQHQNQTPSKLHAVQTEQHKNPNAVETLSSLKFKVLKRLQEFSFQ